MKNILQSIIFLIVTCQLAFSQDLQGSIKLDDNNEKIIMSVRNNGTSTYSGNLSKIIFTLIGTSGYGFSFSELKFMPGNIGAVTASNYYSFGTRSEIKWLGNHSITLSAGATIDLIEFFPTEPKEFKSEYILLIGGLHETTAGWSIIANGVESANQVERFYDSGHAYGIYNDPIRSGVYLGLPDNSTLPVSIIDFSVHQEGRSSLIFWTTANESNSRNFEVEHSIDLKKWVEVGSVLSSQQSNSKKYYSFNHLNPEIGINYYRLKMIDTDETFTYSSIKSLKLASLLRIYPNPVVSEFRVDSQDNIAITSVKIRDTSGNIIPVKTELSNNKVALGNIPAGIYILTLTDKNQTEISSKIIVQK